MTRIFLAYPHVSQGVFRRSVRITTPNNRGAAAQPENGLSSDIFKGVTLMG